MNSDKQAPSNQQARQRGNVMIYILIALGLLGALTYAMMRQADQSSGDNLDKETVALLATKMISYSSAAQNVTNQMIMSGSTIDTIDLVNPTSTGFNTGSNVHKIYHPAGGGLNYETAVIPPFVDSAIATSEGWYITKRNIEWTPTAASDIVLAAYSISPEICNELSKKITGTATPAVLTAQSTRMVLTDFSATALTAALCPNCNGKTTMCVTNGDGTYPTFYAILEAR